MSLYDAYIHYYTHPDAPTTPEVDLAISLLGEMRTLSNPEMHPLR